MSNYIEIWNTICKLNNVLFCMQGVRLFSEDIVLVWKDKNSFKVTVSEISSDPPYEDGKVRFTSIHLKLTSDQ